MTFISWLMNRDWSIFKNILWATSILIAALVLMPIIALGERLRDWIKELKT